MANQIRQIGQQIGRQIGHADKGNGAGGSVGADALLKEDGDNLLLETGDNILLE